MDEIQLLTTKEAATFLHCSRSWLHQNYEKAGLPFIKYNWNILFKKQDLIEFLNKNRRIGCNERKEGK